MWSLRILMRYALVQLPALVLLVLILILVRRWVDLPNWFEWGFIAVWVVKDVALFPFVWPSYERGQAIQRQIRQFERIMDKMVHQ